MSALLPYALRSSAGNFSEPKLNSFRCMALATLDTLYQPEYVAHTDGCFQRLRASKLRVAGDDFDLTKWWTLLMPTPLKEFLVVLVGTSGLLGVVYIGMSLVLGQPWIDANASMVFANGFYWLLIPPSIWAVRYRPREGSSFRSPKLKLIMDDGLMIVEPCEWMGHRTAVSVFKLQDDVELFVFSAYVVNIQSNKLVQLLPISTDASAYDVSKLRESKDKLLIKPGHLHEQ